MIASTILGSHEDPARLLNLAFVLGWKLADHQFEFVPEALVRALELTAASLSISDAVERREERYTYPPETDAFADQASWEINGRTRWRIDHALTDGRAVHIQIAASDSGHLRDDEIAAFKAMTALIFVALECTHVQEHDRKILGAPFAQLTDREWEICEALEIPICQKQLAEKFAFSENTLHCHLKKIYVVTNAQSRLDVIDQLKRAREQVRKRALLKLTTVVTTLSSWSRLPESLRRVEIPNSCSGDHNLSARRSKAFAFSHSPP
ncbi:MAG TPA: hypothetical protein VM008_07500 [Phycisphaerae bacterium]|nr:hypothetical protein [Phycisphaerae bacterium]